MRELKRTDSKGGRENSGAGNKRRERLERSYRGNEPERWNNTEKAGENRTATILIATTKGERSEEKVRAFTIQDNKASRYSKMSFEEMEYRLYFVDFRMNRAWLCKSILNLSGLRNQYHVLLKHFVQSV